MKTCILTTHPLETAIRTTPLPWVERAISAILTVGVSAATRSSGIHGLVAINKALKPLCWGFDDHVDSTRDTTGIPRVSGVNAMGPLPAAVCIPALPLVLGFHINNERTCAARVRPLRKIVFAR